MWHQIFEPAGTRPVFFAWWRTAFADFDQHGPIGERPVFARAFTDRVDDELAGHSSRDHHRPSGQKFRPIDCAPPQHGAVPARRTFVRVEGFADNRMNSVRADQDVALYRRTVRGIAAEEIAGDAAFVLRE